jgi:hypothetical protein
MAKLDKAPMTGMPMKGRPMPPPPPMPKARSPMPPMPMASAAGPSIQAPNGYAWGTGNVVPSGPGPGQTITNGQWPEVATQTPVPLPAPGQSVGLSALRALGQKANLGRAAGDSDVGSPNMGAAGGKASPGYDAQTGDYSRPAPLDDGFVRHLRAAIGLEPKAQGFAGGTPDVPPFSAGFGHGMLDNVISGRLGPVAVGSAATMPAPNDTQMPAPPPAPTGTFNPMTSTFGSDGGPGIVPGPPLSFPSSVYQGPAPKFNPTSSTASPAALPGPNTQGQPGGSVPYAGAPASPQGQPGGSVPPAPAPAPTTMGSMLSVLQGLAPSRLFMKDGSMHTPPDPVKVDTLAKTTGATNNQAYAMLHPENLTEDQFAQEMVGTPIGVAEKLWNMQHYLNPDQQAGQAYLGQLNQDITNAQKDYNAGVESGKPKGQLQEGWNELQKRLDARTAVRRKAQEKQFSYTPDTPD